MKSNKLTPRQIQIAEVIAMYHDKHGYMPSFRELGEIVNLKSTADIQKHIKRLFDFEVLETDLDIGSIPSRGFRLSKNWRKICSQN